MGRIVDAQEKGDVSTAISLQGALKFNGGKTRPPLGEQALALIGKKLTACPPRLIHAQVDTWWVLNLVLSEGAGDQRNVSLLILTVDLFSESLYILAKLVARIQGALCFMAVMRCWGAQPGAQSPRRYQSINHSLLIFSGRRSAV
jgi:hypothetical protein